MNIVRCRTIAVVVGLAVNAPIALANPSGAQVAHGQASFHNPQPNILNITNSPGAVINWQRFGIDAGEITRFIQGAASSSVLNRVVGQDPSAILGSLMSNGRVFLINPNGIVFGPNSVVDTAGLIASTLNLSDEDFHNGEYHFEGDASHGNIANHGLIKTGVNGEVFLIAPNIENEGIIQTDGGTLILAAGYKVTISSLDDPSVSFDIQAPENKIVNLGSLLTGGGAARLLAGSIRHSGDISADTVRVNDDGSIEIIAQAEIELAADSTLSANGPNGGDIVVQSTSGTVWASGEVSATGQTDAGSPGDGGTIQILGERVALLEQANIDASGKIGGEVLIGGDYQGGNAEVQNAAKTYISSDSSVAADGVDGDGGKAIVWADETTQFYGAISARGGDDSGDGGFVEVSGKEQLDFHGHVDVSAPAGDDGSILLDPDNTTIQVAAGPDDGQVGASGFIFTAGGATDFTIGEAAIEALTGSFAIQTEIDLLISFGVNLNLASIGAGETATFQAGGNITSSGAITTAGGNVILSAGDTNATSPSATAALIVTGNITTAGGDVTLRNTQAGGTIMRNGATTNTAGGDLTFDGAATAGIAGGTIVGATINRLVGTSIDLNANTTFTNVIIDTDLRVTPGRTLTSSGATFGLGPSGILRLQGSNARLHLNSHQTISGPGTIISEGTGANSITAQFSNQTIGLDASLLFDLSAAGPTFAIGGTFATLNNAAIIETTGGQSITVSSNTSGSNTGTLRATNGGTLNLVQIQNGIGGTIEVDSGTLNLSSNWSNAAGSLNVNGGLLSLGGTFDETALAPARFNRAGGGTAGTVNIDGTFTNASTFVFDATTGMVNLDGGTLSGGTWQTAAGGGLVTTANSTVTNAILDFDFIVNPGQTLTSNGATLGLGPSGILRLQGSNARLHLNSHQTISGPGTIISEGTGANSITAQFSNQTIGLDASLLFDLSAAGPTFAIGGTFATLNNAAIIETTGGQSITVSSNTSGSNTGTLRATNGGTLNLVQIQNGIGGTIEVDSGTLNLSSNWSNAAGSLNVNGGLLSLGGTFDETALAPARFNRAGGGTAGTVNIDGTFTNASTFVFDATTGMVNLDGGTLSGGTWQTAAGGGLVTTANSTVTNAILDFDFIVNPGQTLTSNGATLGLGPSGILRLQGSNARLHLSSHQTISGPGTIISEGTGANSITAQFSNQTIGLDASLLFDLSAAGPTFAIGGTFATLNNAAIIETTGGQSITVSSNTSGSNTGTLRATNGGTLNLVQIQNGIGGTIEVDSGTLNLSSNWSNAAGSLNVNGGLLSLGGTFDETALAPARFNRAGGGTAGTVNIDGTFTNASTFVFDATTGMVNLDGGTLSGGTWQTAAGGGLVTTANSTVTNAILDFDFIVNPGQTLTSNGATLGLGPSGILRLQGSNARLHLSSHQTISGPGTIISEGTGANSITAQFSNQTIGLDASLLFDLSAAGPTFAIGGTFATLNNAAIIETTGGQSITVSSNTSGSNTGTLRATNGGTLNLVQIQNGIGGTIEVDSGTLNLSSNWSNAAGSLNVNGGLLSLGGTFDETALAPARFNRAGGGTAGTVNIDGTFTNASTFVFDATTGMVNLDGGTLSGGTWQTAAGGGLVTTANSTVTNAILDFDFIVNPGQTLTSNGATLGLGPSGILRLQGSNARLHLSSHQTISGPGSITMEGTGTNSISAQFSNQNVTLAPGLTINGTTNANIAGGFVNLTLGADFTFTGTGQTINILSANPIDNIGTMTIGTGATLVTGNEDFINSGTLILDGSMNLDTGGPVETFFNTGTFSPGASPGLTVITGNLDLTGGILDIEVSGITRGMDPGYDAIDVTGSVTLGGQLNVIQLMAFTPNLGDQLQIINATGPVSGSFSGTNFGALNYNLFIRPNDVTLLHLGGATIFWDGASDLDGDGLNWNDPLNWSTDTLPGAADVVLIALGGGNSVDFNTTSSIDSLFLVDDLNIQSGSLNTSSTMTIDGGFNLSGGNLTGGGILSTRAATNVSAFFSLTGKPWDNAGTITVSSTGRINMVSGSTLTNQTLGVINLTGSDGNPIAFGGGSGSTFDNAGTLNKNTATAQGLNPGAVNNTGTMNVLLGELRLPSPGAHTGLFDISGGATLNFNASTQALNAGASFNGTGDILISGSTNLDINTPVTLAIGGPLLTLSAGTLGGTGSLTIDNTFTITGGTLNDAGLLSTTGATDITASLNLTGKPWDNTGTITVSGGGRINMVSGSTLTNQTLGVIDLTGTDANPIAFGGGAGSTFNNAGTLNKNTATAQGLNPGAVNNTGTMNVLLGELRLPSPGAHTGLFDISGGATLNFNASTQALNAGTSFNGTGDILISGSTNLDINTAVTLAIGDPLLTLSAGTLGGTGSLTVDNTFTITGGTLNDAGLLSTTGATNISALFNLTNKPWDNTGTITVSSTGAIIMVSGATLTNQALGIIDLTGTSANPIAFGGGAGSTFNNGGTLNKNTATTQGLNPGAVNNTGTMNVLLGELRLPSPGAHTGLFDISGGATLNFNASTQALNAGTSFNGTGDILISGSTNLDINTAVTLAIGDPLLTLSAGTLGGTGSLTIDNTFTITGGNLNDAGLLSTTGATNISATFTLTGKPWDNTGTITVSGPGRVIMVSGATLTNQALGIIDLTGSDPNPINFGGGAGSTFDNAGTLNKNTATTQGLNPGVVNNTGTMNVLLGELRLPSSGAHTGLFDISGGATLNFNASNHVLALGTGFTGTGDILISGSSNVNINTPVTLAIGDPLLTISAGTLGGTGLLTIDDTFTATGGTISGTGLLRTTGTTNITGTARLSGKIWDNSGVIAISGTGRLDLANAATLNNLALGVIDITSTNTNAIGFGGGIGSTLNNVGILNKNNAASQNINAGGSTLNTGTINISGGTAVMSGFAINSGTVVISNGATLSTAGFAFTNAVGATFIGDGTISLGGNTFTNDGVLAAGGSPGTLVVSGNFVLSSTSDLDVELAGTNQGVDYDWIDVSGTASVDGNLNVTLFGGFTPTDGDQFTFLTAVGGVSGTFALENLPADFNTIYNSNNIRLDFMSSLLCPGDICWDGGGADTLWTTALNWDTDFIPLINDDVIIDLGGPFIVDFNTAITLNSLTVGGDDTFNLNGGILTLNNASLIDGAFAMNAGTLTGAGPVVVNGAFQWNGGDIQGTGTLTTNPISSTTINGLTAQLLGSRVWNSAGAVTLNPGGRLQMQNTATVNVQSGSVWTLDSAEAQLVQLVGGTPSFNIQAGGIVHKNDAATQTIGVVLNNDGIVNVNAGSLSINGGNHSGLYDVDAGAELALTSGASMFMAGGQLTGAGQATMNGSAVTFNPGSTFDLSGAVSITSGSLVLSTGSPVNFANGLTLGAGSLSGSDDFNLSSLFTWSGGNLGGNGTFTSPSGSSVVINGLTPQLTDTRIWNSDGPVSIDVGGRLRMLGTSTANVRAGSVWAINSTEALPIELASLSPSFNVLPGGVFNKNSGAVQTINVAFDNAGALNLNSGVLNFTTFNQTAGTTSLAGGDLGGTVLNFNGGSIGGAGTIDAGLNLNSTAMNIGAPTDQITVTGNFSMNPTSSLNIDLGGLAQGATGPGGFDYLDVGGIATLGGTLNVLTTGGFTPTIGNAFQFIAATGGTVGTFASENVPVDFFVEYGANDTVLRFTDCIADICWDGSGGDNLWSNALNWDLDLAPTLTDDVLIDLAGIIVVDFNATSSINSVAIGTDDKLIISGGTLSLLGTSSIAGALDVTGGNLMVNGAMDVPGTFNLSGGTLTTIGPTNLSGTFNWSGTGTSTLTGAGTLTASNSISITQAGNKQILASSPILSGTTNWDGAGPLIITGGSTLTNQGNFTVTGPGSVDALSGTNDFLNSATFTKAGPGTLAIFGSGAPLSFDNFGTVNVTGGELQIPGRTLDGTINAAAGTTVTFFGGTNLLNDGSLLSGGGDYQFLPGGGGAISFIGIGSGTSLGPNATFDLSGASAGGTGNLDVQGVLNLSNATFGGSINNNGTVNLDTATINGSLDNNADLNVLSGASVVNGLETNINSGLVTVTGGATLTKDGGAFNWNGGTLSGTGSLFLLAGGATFNISGSGDRVLDGLTLTVSNLNLPGGSFELLSGALTVTGTTSIPSGANFIHSGGALSLDAVNNDGLFSANNGTLMLNNGGSHSGTFATSGSGLLDFSGGTHTLSNQVRFTGDALFSGGALNMSGGPGTGIQIANGSTVTINPMVVGGNGSWRNLGQLNLNDVTLPGTITSSGMLNIAGINNNFTGSMFSITGGSVNIPGGTMLNKIGGTVNAAGGSIVGTGTLATSLANFLVTSNHVINATTLNLESLTVTSGALELQNGAMLNVTGASTISNGASLTLNNANASTSNITNAGNLTVQNGSNVSAAAITTSGLVDVREGAALACTGTYTQSAGTTRVGGLLDVAAGGISINNGALFGTGSIVGNALLDNVTIGPGTSPGTLSIDGDLTLGSNSTLVAELGGSQQGISYDLLAVSGSAVLNGALDVEYVNGFIGSIGDAFDLITYASASGDFFSVFAPLGVAFSSADFGSFYRFTIDQPPEPNNPHVPEVGINPILGTLPDTVDDPINNPLLFTPFTEPEPVSPEDRPISKCN